MNSKIKVSAPRENPHICYISREYEQRVKDIRRETGMSLYSLLCTCSGYSLSSKENIKKFKEKVRKNGFKNIGEWAESLIDMLHENLEDINSMELSSIKLKKTKEEAK